MLSDEDKSMPLEGWRLIVSMVLCLLLIVLMLLLVTCDERDMSFRVGEGGGAPRFCLDAALPYGGGLPTLRHYLASFANAPLSRDD